MKQSRSVEAQRSSGQGGPTSNHVLTKSVKRFGDDAEIAQLVEHVTENHGVASSNLALGTTIPGRAVKRAEVAQLVEHHLAKVRVAGSSPVFRSTLFPGQQQAPGSGRPID